MMRKICLLFICMVPAWLQAQVTMSVQLPPGGLIQKDQLWNVVLMNSGSAGFDAVLLLSLQDVSTGQTMLTASTRSFTLAQGVKNLRIQDLQPVQYNYGGGNLDGVYLPLGAYTACYTVSRVTTETQVPVITECIRVNISPLSPPLLNLPADKSQVTTPYPQFSWMPPAPLTMFTDLSYDLNVVEVLEGQSPFEAMSNNTPLYARSFLHVPYENYAASNRPLEKNKTYAWQITARNGLNYAAATEVWTFNLGGDSNATSLKGITYLEMTSGKSNQGYGVINERKLYLKYHSFEREQETVIQFEDNNGKVIHSVKNKLKYGDNFLDFNLGNQFVYNKIYTVRVKDSKAFSYTASFLIRSTN